jgi:lysophospholipase L1-like esterase
MQIRRFRRPCVAVFAVFLGFYAGNVRANPNIQLVPIADAPTWLRQTLRIGSVDRSPLELSLTASGSVTAYFNGQRLVKNMALKGGLVTWDVTSLARQGNNCLSVSVTPKLSTASSLGAGCFLGGENLVGPSKWKMAPTAPPVGWQRTDFNDGDWKNLAWAGSLDVATLNPVRQRHLDWKRVSPQPRRGRERFRFRDGDHVLLVGGTFVERAQTFGHLESALTAETPQYNVTFRNLGWSADTVFAESRGIFDTPAKGYERMIEHVRAEEPSVIILFYGQNEAMSFEPGPEGVTRFSDQLRQLHDDLSTTGADVVFVSPHPFLAMSGPLPDPSEWNHRVSEFCSAVQAVAASVEAPYVDLFSDFSDHLRRADNLVSTSSPLPVDLSEHPELMTAMHGRWTDNGMHWNDLGYTRVAQLLAARVFGRAASRPEVLVDTTTHRVTATGAEVRNIRWKPDTSQTVTFEFRRISVSAVPTRFSIVPLTRTAGVPLVQYIDSGDTPVSLIRHRDGDRDDDFARFADHKNTAYESLRQLVARRNELYFYRWRPQNITYLFGFRKHEQGNNASEIAQFDPLIEELEEQINKAKRPAWISVSVGTSD